MPQKYWYEVYTIAERWRYDILKFDQLGNVISVYEYNKDGCGCPAYRFGGSGSCKHERILIRYQREVEMPKRDDFNKAEFFGYLTKDPVLNTTKTSGKKVTTFSVAINETYRFDPNDEPRKITTFIKVTSWGRKAEMMCETLRKGSRVFIEGKLRNSTWEEENEEKRTTVYVLCGEGCKWEALSHKEQKPAEDEEVDEDQSNTE